MSTARKGKNMSYAQRRQAQARQTERNILQAALTLMRERGFDKVSPFFIPMIIANLADGAKGAAAGEVFIHELVHQWWGLGNMFDTSDSTSPWSAEGLTVYTTYRIVKELYGADYAQQYYVDQWQQAVDDYYLNFYVRHPEYLEKLPETERLNIAGSLSGVRHYSEMPLKLLKAEQLVGGEAAMDQILHNLFNREIDPMYPYLTYQEFLDACHLTEEELDLG